MLKFLWTPLTFLEKIMNNKQYVFYSIGLDAVPAFLNIENGIFFGSPFRIKDAMEAKTITFNSCTKQKPNEKVYIKVVWEIINGSDSDEVEFVSVRT